MTDSNQNLSRRRLVKSAAAATFALASTAALGVSSARAAKPVPKGGGNEAGFLGSNQITASIMRQFRPVGLMQIDMGIVVSAIPQRERAQAATPALRAAWRGVAQEFVNSFFIPGRVPDTQILGQRMQAVTDRVVGNGIARVVLLSVIVR
ncbi:MAG TPA: hypothetical protein DIU09_06920 [Hyphomonadaceae bacterium]|uniref:hypothetical protein n=1 Tax=Aquidulcibacter sp. TaxID=2052990 RepID=UPI00078D80DE|nr:hypothetical protein [Aquidulcibacter sp.]AMS30458.1 hypothetical protein AEM38_15030 [Hyphomonadaceae bacterium UKL13-1]MCA3696272.1 hypothetical protein [Aquidulcibacter sp.]HCP64305.1 hypothetical protein [Hyphomonadaceae bacterium]